MSACRVRLVIVAMIFPWRALESLPIPVESPLVLKVAIDGLGISGIEVY